jgi:hypothetical protein
VINNNLENPERNPYGMPVTYINMVANHLTDFYEISDVHRVLNQFKHFKTVIGKLTTLPTCISLRYLFSEKIEFSILISVLSSFLSYFNFHN